MVDLHSVPERIAYLTLLFLHQKLTEAEHDELDAWVVESDENTKCFEDMTDVESISFLYNLLQ